MTTTPKNLAAKLAEVVLEVSNVEKDGHNDFQNYDYTSAEALLGAIRKPLASRNITLFPKVTSVEERGIVTPKGKPSTITTARVTFIIVDADTGEREECPWAGTGDDPSDKGLYKAYTGAVKTFLRQQFLLPMGDDPEGDTEADRRTAGGSSSTDLAEAVAALPGTRELVGAEVLAQIETLRKEVGTSPSALKAYAVNTHSVDSLEDLSLDEARMTYAWLAAKQKKAA